MSELTIKDPTSLSGLPTENKRFHIAVLRAARKGHHLLRCVRGRGTSAALVASLLGILVAGCSKTEEPRGLAQLLQDPKYDSAICVATIRRDDGLRAEILAKLDDPRDSSEVSQAKFENCKRLFQEALLKPTFQPTATPLRRAFPTTEGIILIQQSQNVCKRKNGNGSCWVVNPPQAPCNCND